MDSLPDEIALQNSDNNKITVSATVDDNQFIILLPGFIMHNEEVKSENGIPREVLAITDDCCVVDMRDSGLTFIRDMKRGFHFNCIVKMIRIDGKIRAALYATRLKGPLLDDKNRRGFAIQTGSELVLPFDGRIPFATNKTEWKDKRSKVKAAKPIKSPKEVIPPPVKQKKGKKNTSNQNARKNDVMVPLTLFSAFSNDAVPPLPFVILESQSAVNVYKSSKMNRQRLRSGSSRRAYIESDS